MDLDNKKVRFSDADWYTIGPQEIVIGGVGGIGSFAAFFLGRIGHTLYLFDDDTIDETNMAGQLYSILQIGWNKAEAIQSTIKMFSGNHNVDIMGRFEKDSPITPITFSCFDNMTARKHMFEKWAADENRELFVDGRA